MSINLDQYDCKIVHHLQKNGRLTNQELAELIGLSTSQCSRRRILLEQKNIIAGYYAQISPVADPTPITGIIEVKITNYNHENYENFINFAQKTSSIKDIYKLTGHYDFIFKVAVKDFNEMSQLIAKLSSNEFCVCDLNTSIVLEKLKENSIRYETMHNHNT
ncbi:Lrp/AsnC family transcriptional regulator [Acinetobacter pollinis]|uniref:Lrp/AsnC family transcriptional regulator n=1 Tax=Acinetobacter pollinis TaxID=2605270 RepID=UPI0018A2CAA1|nr:Lrp/AsnC family transcriptional regulator [Acinetobacter pollinis]MBF7689184.1 Lrp/AsnC family transcriptional regulator [Acinetobacter pollinis]MBF7691846.1 Lrp/AsnC family transcriptional regulator [Acinetobacter pollinis]MBF7698308.1 Lrp/AsnC family transcriptional regulator [Acinetobacter pollinis]MBF7699951.1 Lrp/AsnC family transcriptional regulator [Acinetobacter pollinis]